MHHIRDPPEEETENIFPLGGNNKKCNHLILSKQLESLGTPQNPNLDEENILNCSSKIIQDSASSDDLDFLELDPAYLNVLAYVAGFIYAKSMKHHKCQSCERKNDTN